MLTLVTPSGAMVLPAAVSTAWIAPDASAAVLVDRASVASLVQIDSDQTDEAVAAEPIELGDADGLVAFLDR